MREREPHKHTDRQTGVGVVGVGEQTKRLLDFTECYVNQRTDTHTYRHADTDIQTHRHTDSLLVPGFLQHVNRIMSPQNGSQNTN